MEVRGNEGSDGSEGVMDGMEVMEGMEVTVGMEGMDVSVGMEVRGVTVGMGVISMGSSGRRGRGKVRRARAHTLFMRVHGHTLFMLHPLYVAVVAVCRAAASRPWQRHVGRCCSQWWPKEEAAWRHMLVKARRRLLLRRLMGFVDDGGWDARGFLDWGSVCPGPCPTR